MTVFWRPRGDEVTARSPLVLQAIEVLTGGKPGPRHWIDVAAAGGALPDLGGLRTACDVSAAGMVWNPGDAARLTCPDCQVAFMRSALAGSS